MSSDWLLFLCLYNCPGRVCILARKGQNAIVWVPFRLIDELMAESGLRYAVLDGHGLLNADPRPRYGLYAPICTRKGVAFFGRDSESTLPVWSARDGYPGNPNYREFHRDLGWDLSIEKLKKSTTRVIRLFKGNSTQQTSSSQMIDHSQK